MPAKAARQTDQRCLITARRPWEVKLKPQKCVLTLMFFDPTQEGGRLEADDVQRPRDQEPVGRRRKLLVGIGVVLRQPFERTVAPRRAKVVGLEGGRERQEDERDEPQSTDPRYRVATQASDPLSALATVHTC